MVFERLRDRLDIRRYPGVRGIAIGAVSVFFGLFDTEGSRFMSGLLLIFGFPPLLMGTWLLITGLSGVVGRGKPPRWWAVGLVASALIGLCVGFYLAVVLRG
ncbi:MAG: hypothetical protein QM778_22380 [Myxococcales bacterium]